MCKSKPAERILSYEITTMYIRTKIRDGHADIRINFRIIRQYCAISDICWIMRISASMRIAKYIRMAIPSRDMIFTVVRMLQKIQRTSGTITQSTRAWIERATKKWNSSTWTTASAPVWWQKVTPFPTRQTNLSRNEDFSLRTTLNAANLPTWAHKSRIMSRCSIQKIKCLLLILRTTTALAKLNQIKVD